MGTQRDPVDGELAAGLPGPAPDGDRLALPLRGPGEGVDSGLDLGSLPGRLALAPLGPLPLDRGPPPGPPCRGRAERLGPRPAGLALLLGAFSRFAALSGIVLLGLYYVASPPLVGLPSNGSAEGAYLIVNKNLVEILALCVAAAFPVGGFFGLERAASRLLRGLHRPAPADGPATVGLPPDRSRRELIAAAASLPVLGGFVWAVLRKRGFDSYETRLLRRPAPTWTR